MQGVIPPGSGGDGGRGGDGVRGGRGGHGGIASNVFVSLPPGQESQIRVLAHPSGGGRGAPGRPGGDGGMAGRGGAHAPEPGTDVSRPRPGGSPGCPGTDGLPGRDGRARPAPPVFVNERAVEPMRAPAQVPPTDAVRSRDKRRGAVFTSTRGEQGQ